jgi:hypothetical protein
MADSHPLLFLDIHPYKYVIIFRIRMEQVRGSGAGAGQGNEAGEKLKGCRKRFRAALASDLI